MITASTSVGYSSSVSSRMPHLVPSTDDIRSQLPGAILETSEGGFFQIFSNQSKNQQKAGMQLARLHLKPLYSNNFPKILKIRMLMGEIRLS